MIKPIFIVKTVDQATMSVEDAKRLSNQLEAKLIGYHVLIAWHPSQEPAFELYNSEDAEVKNIEEIKDMLINGQS